MLANTVQYIIPYNDLVDMFYISLCGRFVQPSNPAVSILGYSELENIVKECYNGTLYEITGNASYTANLDETLFKVMQQRFVQALMFHGFTDYNKQLAWWNNMIEEVIFPKVIERVSPLRNLGMGRLRIDWRFDHGCVLVAV